MVTLLPTPIGNIGDTTYRTLEILKNTQLILCEDTRVTKQLINLYKTRYNLGNLDVDFISFNEHNGATRLEQFGERIKDENVVYMSDAGMPVISDPGQLLVEFCQKEGIEYDVLPGASAAPLIYAASGFESGKFYFYGFLPSKGKERTQELNKVLSNGIDTILYEAPHRIVKLIEQICDIDENRELFVAKELTKRYQKYYRVTAKEMLSRLENDSTKGEWALVVKAKISSEPTLNLQQVLDLDIPPKPKAKLISALTGNSVKECYEKLQKK